MLLTQFKEVSKIDTQIQHLHGELAKLYERRSELTRGGQAGQAPTGGAATGMATAEAVYGRLVQVWNRYGIKPPTYKYLRPAITRALGIVRDLAAAQPELQGALDVVLVPPTKELQQALASRAAVQPFVQAVDSIDAALPRPTARLKWRVYVMHTASEGLAEASARTLLAGGRYRIGGHDANALGQQEYMALTLHCGHALDETAWTMLLRDADADADMLPCATFSHGRYRFDHDDLDNIFGDNRFRPAVEV